MCVIVYRPAGKSIPQKILKNCYDNNSDGWGIMYRNPETSELVVVKDVSSFQEFYKAYRAVPRGVDLGMHFRWKTHGSIKRDNCHPFEVLEKDKFGRDLLMMHNGVIQTVDLIPDRTDSYHYAQFELQPLLAENPDLIFDTETQKIIEADTSGSKLLFLDSHTGKFVRTGKPWHSEYGCFFSNQHSLEDDYGSYYSGRYGGGTHNWDSYDDAMRYGDGGGYGNYSSAKGRTSCGVGAQQYFSQNGNLKRIIDASLEPEREYDELVDPFEMTETEIFNWVVQEPEAATDYILELTGRR